MPPALSGRSGHWATALAFVIWGFFPLYWKALSAVPPLQIMANRLVWCAVWVLGFLLITRGLSWLKPLRQSPKILATLSLTGLMIAVNWGLYIWAVNNGHVIESSLGYFITPLVNVMMGVVVLKERLSPGQKLAFGLAGVGVLWLTFAYGQLPWVALMLALSFGGYGLLRKLTPVDAVSGLAVESLILFLPMLGLMLWWQQQGQSALQFPPNTLSTLLVLGGLVTAIPLILFAYGARRVPLTTVGLMQFIGPTIQFLCGVFFFKEHFGGSRAMGFCLIWAGCACYIGEMIWQRRKAAAMLPE